MKIQFGAVLPLAQIKNQNGMSVMETMTALSEAFAEKDAFIRSGKADRADVVILDNSVFPEMPKDTGMILLLVTNKDYDEYITRKDTDPQNLARELYKKSQKPKSE